MIPKNQFEQYDEVIVNGKNGIVLDFVYIQRLDTYNYCVDCEEEIIVCEESELEEA
jgi:hypothetical protein